MPKSAFHVVIDSQEGETRIDRRAENGFYSADVRAPLVDVAILRDLGIDSYGDRTDAAKPIESNSHTCFSYMLP